MLRHILFEMLYPGSRVALEHWPSDDDVLTLDYFPQILPVITKQPTKKHLDGRKAKQYVHRSSSSTQGDGTN